MSIFGGRLSEIVAAFSSGSEKLYKQFNSVIIVAAGNGTRMGGEIPKTKQMADLCGIPVIVRTIRQFEACGFINEIIVVAREDEVDCYSVFREQYGLQKHIRVTVGGDTRQKSVFNGFELVSEKSQYVAIHDGARCLVTPEMIEKVFLQAYIYGSATAAERSKDTIKRADKSGFIDETIDRAYLWHAQTPQIFKTDIYRAAAYIAKENGFTATDDCMLAENIGFKVKLVDCGYENLKLTTPDDFYTAKAILDLRADREAKQKGQGER